MAVLRPARRDSNSNYRNGRQRYNVNRSSTFHSPHPSQQRQAFYNMPTPPMTRRYYSTAAYDSNQMGRPRYRPVPPAVMPTAYRTPVMPNHYRPPSVDYRSSPTQYSYSPTDYNRGSSPIPNRQIHRRMSSYKSSPIITEVRSDEPTSFQSRDHVPFSSQSTNEPNSLESITFKAMTPKLTSPPESRKLTVRAELVPPPIPPPPPPPLPQPQIKPLPLYPPRVQLEPLEPRIHIQEPRVHVQEPRIHVQEPRMHIQEPRIHVQESRINPPRSRTTSGESSSRRIDSSTTATTDDFYGMYDSTLQVPSSCSVQVGTEVEATEIGTQFPAIEYRPQSVLLEPIAKQPKSQLPRPTRRNGRRSSSGSEAGRSFDETLVQQSVKFYSTSSQCYFADVKEMSSSQYEEESGSHRTISVKSHRVKSVEVSSSIPTKVIALNSKSHSFSRSRESDSNESYVTNPIIVSTIPKMSTFRDRKTSGSGDSGELLISRSFATTEMRRKSPSSSSSNNNNHGHRKSKVPVSNRKKSSKSKSNRK